MNSDDLLRQLAQMTRDEQADERWEKLARGELSPAEDAALRAEAERDPEAALLYEAYRPLDEAAKSKIVEQIAAKPVAGAGANGSTGARVFPWRRAAIVLLPLATAAAFVLWGARPGSEPVASLDAPLPAYALSAIGGDRTQRSEAPLAGPISLRRDSRLELVLRPSAPITGAVTVRAFLVQGGAARARAWTPPMDRSADGAVRIAGPAGELLGIADGTVDIVFAVGRADAVPTDPRVVASAMGADAGGRAWQMLVTRVTIAGG